MKPIFINLTNHPSELWERKQLEEAEKYGKVLDIPFPNVKAEATEEEIKAMSEEMADRVMNYDPSAVLCQGEFTLAFQIINRLLEKEIPVVAACSERVVVEKGNRK